MPRVYEDTRLYKARKLLKLIEKGPASIDPENLGMTLNRMPNATPLEILQEIQGSYKIWFDSWVAPQLNELIPELRKNK